MPLSFANPIEQYLTMMMQGQVPPGAQPEDDLPRDMLPVQGQRVLPPGMMPPGMPPSGIAGAGARAPGVMGAPPQVPPAPDSRIMIFPGLNVPNPLAGQTIRNPFTGAGVQSPLVRQPPSQPAPPAMQPPVQGNAPPIPNINAGIFGQVAGDAVAGQLPPPNNLPPGLPRPPSINGVVGRDMAPADTAAQPGVTPAGLVNAERNSRRGYHQDLNMLLRQAAEQHELPPVVGPAEYLRQNGYVDRMNPNIGQMRAMLDGYRTYVGESQGTYNQAMQRMLQERMANQQMELGQAREGREMLEAFGHNGIPGRMQTNWEAVNRQFGPDALNAAAFERFMSEGRQNQRSEIDLRREWQRSGRTIPVHAGGQTLRTPIGTTVLPGPNGAGPRIVDGLAEDADSEPIIGDTPLNQILMRLARPGVINARTGETPPRIPITSFLEGAMSHAGLGPVFDRYIGDVLHFMQQQGYGAPGANSESDPDFNTWWTRPETVGGSWSNMTAGRESRDLALRNRLARIIQQTLPESGVRPTQYSDGSLFSGNRSWSFSPDIRTGFTSLVQRPLPPGLADQLRRARNRSR